MKLRRLMLITVVVLLATGFTLQACAEWSFEKAAEPFKGKTLRMVAEAYAPLWAYKEIAKDFQAVTGIKVEIEGLEYGNLVEKITADATSKIGYYDVFALNTFLLGRVAENEWAFSNDAFLDRSEITRPDFDPLREFPETYKAACYYQGEYYGIPYQYIPPGFVYQKEPAEHPEERQAFRERYGYEMPIPPQTWIEYYQLAEFFTRKKGDKLAGKVLQEAYYGTCTPLKRHECAPYQLNIFIVGMGGDGLIGQKGEITANTPVFRRALELYMLLGKFSTPAILDYTWDEMNRDIMMGKFFMAPQWPDAMAYFEDPKESKVAGKLGYFLPPETKRIWADTHTCFVSRPSKNPEMGWLWLQYISQYDVQKKYQRLKGSTFRLDVLNDPEFASIPWIAGYLAEAKHVVPTMKIPEMGHIIDIMMEGMSKIGAKEMTIPKGIDWIVEQEKEVLGQE